MSLADQSQQWYPTSVKVTVFQAKNLRIKGKHGTNDAYAIMQVAKERFSTAVAEKSVSPVWKEEASFDLPLLHHGNEERCTLRVSVMHRALVGMDKQLGQAVINLLDLHENENRSKTEWFKLLDKHGKEDKERGEVLLDIQFMRNNMTASMFDLSGQGKSRSRMGKLKDKIRGKKGGLSDSASTVVPAFSSPAFGGTQVMTDSEGEGEDHANDPGDKKKKKKSKIKSLFVPKSNLQRNVSQSMFTLGSFPEKDSTLSGSRSSGLNEESPEGKKKFKFLTHKRTESSDSKSSFGAPFLLGRSKQGVAEQSGVCINGSHVYVETPSASSTISLHSSDRGSLEDLQWGQGRSDLPSRGEEEERIEEERERSRLEEQEMRSLKEEQERKQEEQEKKRIEDEQKMRWLEEQERARKETEQEMRRLEEEREKRLEEEQERKREEQKKREEEQEMRKEEEEERRRREEEQEMRWRQEKEEERKREEERRRRREEEDEIKRKEKEQEMRREEEKMRRREEEQEIRRQKEEEEEKMRREEEEELKRREKEQEMRRQKEEEEEMRREEEVMMREKEQELRRKKEEEEEKMRREEDEELKRGKKEQEMRQKEEEEEEMRREEEAMMMRREKEQELRRQKEEEEAKMRRDEEELKRGEKEQEMSRQKEEEMRRWREEEHELQRKREEEQEMKREEQELEKKRLEEARKEEMLRHQKEREAELKAEEVASLDNPFTTEASSSNPFTEATSSNPFEESPHSVSASHVSRSARISAVKPRSVMSLQTGTDKRSSSFPPADIDSSPSLPLPHTFSSSSDSSLSEAPSLSPVTPGDRHVPAEVLPTAHWSPKESLPGGTESPLAAGPAATDTEKKRRAPLPPPTSRFLPALPTQSQPCPPQEPMPTPLDPPVASARVRKGAAPPKPLSTALTLDSGAGERQESSEAWGGASNSRDGLRQLDNRPNDGSPANHGQGGSDRRLWSAVGPEEKANEMMTVRETCSRPLAPKTPFDDDDDDDDNEALNVKRSGGAVLVHGDPSSPSGGHIGNNHVSRVGCLEGGSGQVFPTGEQQAEPVTGAVLPPDPPASATPNHSRQDDPFEGGQRREETVTGWEMTTESQKKRKNRAPLPPGAPHEDCASRDGDPVVIPPPVQCTPPPSEPQRSKVAGRRRAPQPASGAVSGGRSLLQAWLSPPEPQSIMEGQSGEGGGAPGKVGGPPTAPRRPHPVKPLSSLESHYPGSSPGRDLGSTEGKAKATDSMGSGGGPYSLLTHPELVSLVIKQQGQLSEKDSKIRELEVYIDNLLVRIIEEQPSILQSMSMAKKAI